MINRLKEPIARLSGIFKTDLDYIIKQGGVLSLSQFSSIFISFGLTIAFANLVSQETYGIYRYILSVYSLITVFTLSGLDTAVLQSVSRGFEGSFIKGTITKLRWGTLGSLVAVGYAIFNFLRGDVTLAIIFFVVGFALPFIDSFGLYNSFFNAKKNFKMMALFDIIVQVVSALSLILTMLLTKNVVFIITAYFLPNAAIRICLFFYTKKKFVTNSKIDDKLIKYGWSVSIFHVMGKIINSIDQIVLFNFLGPAQLAIFSLAMAIPSRISGFFKPLATIAFPNFAQRKFSEVAGPLIRKTLLLGVFISAGCIIYFFLSPYLFKYIFPKYIPSIKYSQVLMLYTLSAITYPFSSLVFAHKKMKLSYIMTISNLAAKIISLIIFVPLIGIWGAVISVLASSLSNIAFSLYFLKRGTESNEGAGAFSIYN